MLKNFLKGRKKEKGFTLVEFLVVLGLILVLVAVITMATYKANQRVKISRTKSQVLAIVGAAKTFLARNNNYDDVAGIDILAQNHLLPEDWAAKGFPAPWGGNYSLHNNQNTGTITIDIPNIATNLKDDMVENLGPSSIDQNVNKDGITWDGTTMQYTFR